MSALLNAAGRKAGGGDPKLGFDFRKCCHLPPAPPPRFQPCRAARVVGRLPKARRRGCLQPLRCGPYVRGWPCPQTGFGSACSSAVSRPCHPGRLLQGWVLGADPPRAAQPGCSPPAHCHVQSPGGGLVSARQVGLEQRGANTETSPRRLLFAVLLLPGETPALLVRPRYTRSSARARGTAEREERAENPTRRASVPEERPLADPKEHPVTLEAVPAPAWVPTSALLGMPGMRSPRHPARRSASIF